MAGSRSILPAERIERTIYLIRGQKVILDSDLAKLYGASTKRFTEQVRRNADRFPDDFMFQLSDEEWDTLRSQTATSKRDEAAGDMHLSPSPNTGQRDSVLSIKASMCITKPSLHLLKLELG